MAWHRYAADIMHACMVWQVADGVTFLVVAEESFGRRIPFAFLEDVRARFMAAYASGYKEAVAYEYNSAFSKVIAADRWCAC